MNEPVSDTHPQSKRQPPKRLRPAQIAARALNPRHRKFADLYLSGMPAGRAYERVFAVKDRDSADSLAATLMGRPRVRTYIGAMQDQAVAGVVLSQEVLHGHAMVIARGDREDCHPSIQMEAIRYLDACLNRNRTIKIEGLTLRLDVDERHVAALAFAALEAEAKGELGADDARHLLESASLAMQIMHGRRLGLEMEGGPQLARLTSPPAGSNGTNGQHPSGNGHAGNGHANGTAGVSITEHANGDVTVAQAEPRPVRPKWLRSPEQIAAQAKERAARKKEKAKEREAKKSGEG